MFRWVPYPFIRITGFLCLGILYGILSGFPLSVSACTLCITALSFAYFALWKYLSGHLFLRYHFLLGLVLSLIMMSMGYSLAWMATETHNPSHLIHQEGQIDHYTATVIHGPIEKPKTHRYYLKVDKIRTKGIWKNTEGKVVLYLFKRNRETPYGTGQSTTERYRYGDHLLLSGTPMPIPRKLLENGFDYRAYMQRKQLHHQQFTRPGKVKKIGHSPESPLIQIALSLKGSAQKTLHQYVQDSSTNAVLQALVLGDKHSLDSRTKALYARTGTIHLLAVSGLHVGIIYLVLQWLFSWLLKKGPLKILFPIICLTVLGGYTLLTGASPSVIRAVIMFGCVIIAHTSQRESNIYNTLFIAAFISLCIDPYMLFSIGFQLSYLAVLGIVYLQPHLYRWLTFRNTLGDKIWSLGTVTLAAQLATFPLCLYYFHQFPVYFLFSNLIAVPSASLLLCLGFLVILTSFVPPVANIMAQLLEAVFWLFNRSIHFFGNLPFATWTGIDIDLPHTLMIMVSGICLILMLEKRDIRYLRYGVTVLTLSNIAYALHLSGALTAA